MNLADWFREGCRGTACLTAILTEGENSMKAIMKSEAVETITTHYIDGVWVESHGRDVMDLVSPTTGRVIGRVTLGDEEDTRRAIAAAKRAFAIDEGRTRGDFAPAACGRFGARR